MSIFLQQLSEKEIQSIDTELKSVIAVAQPLTHEMDDEMTKLGKDLKSAEKMDEYFRDYEKRLTQPISQHSVHQRKVSNTQFNTPNHQDSSMISSISSIMKPTTTVERRTRDDSGYPISVRSDGQQRTNSIAKSTPLSSGKHVINTTPSTQYRHESNSICWTTLTKCYFKVFFVSTGPRTATEHWE